MGSENAGDFVNRPSEEPVTSVSLRRFVGLEIKGMYLEFDGDIGDGVV